jgi:hypothetical protein
MEAAVPGLEAEEQLVRFGTTLGMKADTGSVGDRCPAPQGNIGPPQDAKDLEKQRRVIRSSIGASRPCRLVEAEKSRLAFRENPPVAGGGDQLRVGHVAQTLQNGPLPFCGARTQVSSGLLDQAAPQLRLGLLHSDWIVLAQGIQGRTAIRLGVFRGQSCHRASPFP